MNNLLKNTINIRKISQISKFYIHYLQVFLAINWLILYYWTIVLHPLKKFDQLSNVYCSLANEKMKLQKGMLSDILQFRMV